MKTIDERLAEVLAFLCDKNEINPVDMSSKNVIKFSPNNREDIDALRQTINYLKDYAKMKIVAQSIGEKDTLERDMDEAIASLTKQIEAVKQRIAELPNKKRTKIPSENLFGFEAEIAAKKLKDIEKFNANIDAQKDSMKKDIQNMKDKIKELQSMKKDLVSPNRIIKRFFESENREKDSNYAGLINMCATSILSGFHTKELLGENGVFTQDPETNQYHVNTKNARKLISTLKKKKNLLVAVEYINAKRESIEKANTLKKSQDKIAVYQKAMGISSSSEFASVHDTINDIIRDYNHLLKSEYNDYEGNPIKRGIRTFIDAIGFHRLADMPSRKVRRERMELENSIRALIHKMNTDSKFREVCETYVSARNSILGQDELSINNLLIASQNLTGGFGRVELPRRNIEFSDLLKEIENISNSEKEKAKKLEEESNASREKAEKMLAELPAGALKILEDYSEDAIIEFVKDYHGATPIDSRLNRAGKRVLSKSSAIMILESILTRKNLSFDTVCEKYASILGEKGISEEKIDLDRLMEEKTKSLQEQIANLAKPQNAEIEENDQNEKVREIKGNPVTGKQEHTSELVQQVREKIKNDVISI